MSIKWIEAKGLQFAIREGTTDEKVVPEVVTRHSYIRQDFSILPGEYWLDIGANIGTFSCFAAQRGAKVLAYEPEQDNYKLLLQNIAANGYSKVITPINRAVTYSGNDTVLYTCKSQRNKYRHSVIPHKGWIPVKMETVKFDEVLQSGIDCIKMDCEGAEFNIFDNCKDWSGIKKLVFEYHFDIDRKIVNFLRRMEILSKYFTRIYYSKLPPGETYDFFPASKIVYCQR